MIINPLTPFSLTAMPPRVGLALQTEAPSEGLGWFLKCKTKYINHQILTNKLKQWKKIK